MRACSKSDSGALVVGAITVVLGLFFWFPVGPRSVSLMPPVSLEGKTWVLHDAAPAPARRPPSAQENRPKTGSAKATRPSHRKAAKIRNAVAHAAGGAVSSKPDAPKAASPEEPRPSSPSGDKESSAVAVGAVVAPGPLDPIQEHTMQDLIDGFETDPSKYPLDRTVRSGGIALTLEGLQRQDKLFVLKVAVANETAEDFFVKEFTARAGTTILGTRTLFRILVEPQRVREGYVVFEKPLSGADVQIKLKEDGGKGRTLEAGVPYRF